jgi:putative ABC transport system ATP-binding protein
MRRIVITLRGVTKHYDTPAGPFAALRGIDLDIAAGELVAIVGRSGSGKSTLLNVMGGIDRPSSGSVGVAGETIGFVFQFFQLLPALTVAENVMLPLDFAGTLPRSRRRARAMELLERVGVAEQAAKLPSALSGGQQQRVAIARALANDPPLVLADEPTGNLDSATAASVFALFAELARGGKTVVVVTHQRDAENGAGRTIAIADGCVA